MNEAHLQTKRSKLEVFWNQQSLFIDNQWEVFFKLLKIVVVNCLLYCTFIKKDVLLQYGIKTILLCVDDLSIKVVLNSFWLALLFIDNKVQALNLFWLTLDHIQESLSFDVEIYIQLWTNLYKLATYLLRQMLSGMPPWVWISTFCTERWEDYSDALCYH